MVLTHTDYTVGWVCALSKEQTAAIAMLDQIHPELPKARNDTNAYTLGSIGKHNVVIACLPIMGIAPAATVAAHMITTFPAIKFGLMVGIGGGIPPVRLGDVVVGFPVDAHPGVVQWNRGKDESDGFKRTGALSPPPTALLTAIRKMQSRHEMMGTMIPDYLDHLRIKYPRLAKNYLKSDSFQDKLYCADYDHIKDKGNNDRCQHCDDEKAEDRGLQEELDIHYGLIASGDQVIKNAASRDGLCKRLEPDGKLLCVEMEAAGLANTFPCLVIRGICDYADSHKNKEWQEHAAAVAAAYAKDLLGDVQPSDVENEETIKDVLSDGQ